MAQRIQTNAISIQRFPYAETSQIVHLLSEDLGRVGVVVKGAFRPKNSYQGPIDLLVRGPVTLTMLPGRELGTLTRREVETCYPELRRSLPRFWAAHHLLGLVLVSTPVGQGDAETYRLLDRALLTVERLDEERLPLLLLCFDLHLLKSLGLTPCLEACVRCGGVRALSRFVPAEGGVVCRSCRLSEDEGLLLRKPVWEALQEVGASRLSELMLPSPGVLEQGRRIVESHLSYHLDWQPTPDLGVTPGGRRGRRRTGA